MSRHVFNAHVSQNFLTAFNPNQKFHLYRASQKKITNILMQTETSVSLTGETLKERFGKETIYKKPIMFHCRELLSYKSHIHDELEVAVRRSF